MTFVNSSTGFGGFTAGEGDSVGEVDGDSLGEGDGASLGSGEGDSLGEVDGVSLLAALSLSAFPPPHAASKKMRVVAAQTPAFVPMSRW